MRVLGVETSCDETGVAVYDGDQGLVANALYSQVGLHARYGGVVPELASRDHVRKLTPMLREVIAQAGGGIDGVAYTAGPGLVGALMVGAAVARSLGLVMRHLFGIGTARGLQAEGGLAGAFCFALLNVLVILWHPRSALARSPARRTHQPSTNLIHAIAA